MQNLMRICIKSLRYEMNLCLIMDSSLINVFNEVKFSDLYCGRWGENDFLTLSQFDVLYS